MSSPANRPVSTLRVVIAFATVYIVWGSTYFFIQMAVRDIPPMLVGCFRFLTAGLLMLLFCLVAGLRIFIWKDIRPAIVSGLLLLFGGTGILIWSEQYLPSSLAAILLASGPVWFVLLDKRKWRENFRSRATIIGMVVGFLGIVLLFGEQLLQVFSGAGAAARLAPGRAAGTELRGGWQIMVMVILLLGAVSWAAGSLYAKYRSTGKSNAVNAGWQMLAAGVAYIPAAWIGGELGYFHWQTVNLSSWLSVLYLVTMGSLAGYSAFVWLLQVRSATQVSTHAYVNPVVAVLLGVLFAGEKMSSFQLLGLAIILVSVLLINLAKYRGSAAGAARREGKEDTGVTGKEEARVVGEDAARVAGDQVRSSVNTPKVLSP